MSAKRTVVHIVGRGDTYGGAQRYVESVARHQLANADDVSIWCGAGGVFVDHLAEAGFPVAVLKGGGVVRSVVELRHWLTSTEPDLVVVHSTAMCLLVRLALTKVDLPLVLTVHGAVFGPDRPPVQRVGGAAVEFVASRLRPAHMVAISEADQRRLNGWVVGSANSVYMVPNWVDDTPRSSSYSAGAAFDRGQPKRVGMVARVDRPKRPDVVVRAIAALPQPVHLDLLGGGDSSEIAALADELGVGDRVHFHGEVDDVQAVASRWVAGILVSEWEGVPLSVIEYLRDGLPVVASDVGSVSELVDDGVNGFLLAKNNPYNLAEALQKILADPVLRQNMAQASRVKFEQARSAQTVMPKLLAIYDSIVDQRQAEQRTGIEGVSKAEKATGRLRHGAAQ